MVKVTVGGTSIEGPAWIQPGLADGVIGCALGYGRTKVGRVGRGSGFNAYPLYTSASRHVVRGVKIEQAFRRHTVAVTQEHGLMEGRPVVREANLAQFAEKPDFASPTQTAPSSAIARAAGCCKNSFTGPVSSRH